MRGVGSSGPCSRLLGGILAVAVVLTASGHSRASESDRVAVDNTAYVSTDAGWLRRGLERADQAALEEDWPTAVRLYQELVETREDPDDAGAAAPGVVAVYGSVVYEGAWIVAHHRILEGGAPALAAYAAAFGSAAAQALDRATAARDEEQLADLVDRWLPLAEGRRAALLLASIAAEAGDADGAMGWLERLEDVEEVSTEPEESLAPWREARIRVTAALLAAPGHEADVAAFLREAAAPHPAPAMRYAAPPPGLRRRPPPPDGWPTTGGNPARAGLPEGPGTAFDLAWWQPLQGGLWMGSDRPQAAPASPSPWLPPSAVVDGTVAFVSDGGHVDVWDLANTRLLAEAAPLAGTRGGRQLGLVSESDVREELGLLEGHALTLGPRVQGGRILYASAPDPSAGSWWDYDYDRQDRIEALLWNGRALEPLWRAGGRPDDADLPEGTRLYGAPLLYRDRLWVAGVRRARGAEHEADLWLFALDPRTGALRMRTFLGKGPPVRPRRPDEGIPSSPAGAAGRVVVSTSMGVVAAVDARHGRPHWVFRNDRGVVGAGRPRRLQADSDRTPRESGFENRPPLLAWERCWVAPTDGPTLLTLFDRPRGRGRVLVSHALDRLSGLGNLAVEQIVGVHPGGEGHGPLLVVVGKGKASEGDAPAPIAWALDPFTMDRRWWASATTGDGPEPFGTALLTRTALFVPTRHGISVFDLATGDDRATLDMGSVPPDLQELLGPEVPIAGNCYPAPGLGLLVLNGTHGVLWRARR